MVKILKKQHSINSIVNFKLRENTFVSTLELIGHHQADFSPLLLMIHSMSQSMKMEKLPKSFSCLMIELKTILKETSKRCHGTPFHTLASKSYRPLKVDSVFTIFQLLQLSIQKLFRLLITKEEIIFKKERKQLRHGKTKLPTKLMKETKSYLD